MIHRGSVRYLPFPGHLSGNLEFEFRVDLGLLSVRLFTSERVPILVRQERQRLRARIPSRKPTAAKSNQPQIGRQPKLFNGGFLDYNLNANTQDFENLLRQPAPSPAALKSSTAMCRAV